MRRQCAVFLGIALACSAAACGGSLLNVAGGRGTALVDGASFEVGDLRFVMETGDDGFFRIEGDDAAHREEDCLPGLGGGLALYGDLPAGVTTLADLAGRDLPFEFTGDGDDFNLCFVGSGGLLGVESGTVHIAAVDGTRVTFSFEGRFIRYDGEGRESAPMDASGSGVAQADADE